MKIMQLDYPQIQVHLQLGAQLLDLRLDYSKAFISDAKIVSLDPNSLLYINININSVLILILEKQIEQISIIQLNELGYKNIIGTTTIENYLKTGGTPLKSVRLLSLKQFVQFSENQQFLDVRSKDEWKQEGYLPNALLIQLNDLQEQHHLIPRDKDIYIYCRSGHRANLALGILLNLSFKNLVIVKEGGYQQLLSQLLRTDRKPKL